MYYFPDTEYIYSSLMSGFFTKEEINPKLNELCINYEKVRDEYASVKDQLVYTNWNSNNAYNTIGKNPYEGWKVAAMYARYHPAMESRLPELEKMYDQKVYLDPERHIAYTENAKKLPTLFNLCYEAGLRARVGVSVLEPGKVIDWHTDPDPTPDDDLIIRGLWGIDINPQNQETCQILLNSRVDGVINEVMMNNRMHFFWGRTQHHVFSNLSTPRVCLCFDNIVPRQNLL